MAPRNGHIALVGAFLFFLFGLNSCRWVLGSAGAFRPPSLVVAAQMNEGGSFGSVSVSPYLQDALSGRTGFRIRSEKRSPDLRRGSDRGVQVQPIRKSCHEKCV